MRDTTAQPQHIIHPPGTPAETRTRIAAAALGLSEGKQVRCIPRTSGDPARRLQRMRRLVLAAGDNIQAAFTRAGRRYRAAMVTLTYRPDARWEPRHVSAYLDHVRQWLRRRGHQLHAIWVLELQRRGAPHYHVLIWLPPKVRLPKPDTSGWWPHGMSRIEWARRPVGYLAKYASKGDDQAHLLPKGARIYGICGCPIHLGWWRGPAWMRDIASPGMRIQYRRGGWWTVQDLAHAWRSPWRLGRITDAEVEIIWVGWTDGDVRPLYEIEMAERVAARAEARTAR